MTKLLGTLSAVLLAGLIACTGSAKSEADQAAAGVSGTAPKGSGKLNDPTSGTASTTDPSASDTPSNGGSNAKAGDAGTADAAATTTPTTPTVETCATLATESTTPAGTLQVTASPRIQAQDVYATQDANGLTIVLTTTTHECGYRANNLAHQSVNEVQILTPATGTPFAPGTFQPSQIETTQGTACIPADDNNFNGDNGTSFQTSGAQGTLTITAIDAGSVTGTMDVIDFRGRETTFTFTAPICASVTQDQQQNATCCADPTQ